MKKLLGDERNSGEGALLDGGDSLATRNDGGEDVTLHGNTEREGNDVKEQKVLGLGGSGLAGKDTGLDSGTVGNSLIGVDALQRTGQSLNRKTTITER